MFKNLLNKIKATTIKSSDDFLENLLKNNLDEELLLNAISSNKINLNHKDANGDSFLHICLNKSKFKSASWLIKNNIDITIVNNNGKNTLYYALEKENLNIINLIMDQKKIDIDFKDEFGRTLLQDAIVLGHNKIAKVFIEHGANLNSIDNNGRNIMYDALSFGNNNFINYLLSLNKIELDNIDVNEDSLMHHPQILKDDQKALMLINAGAKTTLLNKKNESFLCNTALRGMDAQELISAAVEHGANLNARVNHNNTILMELIAASTNLSPAEMVRRESLLNMSQKILDDGIDANALDENNESALFQAVRASDTELVSFLLSSGINPNIQNNNSQTVLFEASYKGIENLNIVLLLLKYNATPTLKNKNNETLYEIINNIILHTHGKKQLEDKFVLSRIKKDGQHIMILKELLSHNTENLDYNTSQGEPLFFAPLLNDHFPLFKLYILNGLNINNTNKIGHSIFFEYILNAFQIDDEHIDFQNNISMLLSAKLDQNFQDKSGFTVLHSIMSTHCNQHLFDTLTQVILFDYALTDNIGRSVMHTAVWHDKKNVMKKIHLIDPKVVNIHDDYGILPITYAALLGNQELVLMFIALNSNVKSGVNIPSAALKKFSPMLKNLTKLEKNVVDPDILRKMRIVIDQVKRDFKVI